MAGISPAIALSTEVPSTTARVLTLSEVLTIARENSPDISALRNQMESAQAKARQALSPSEPSFSLSYNDMDQFTGFAGRASSVYSISQPLGFPGKAWMNRAAQTKQARAIESQMKAMELQVMANVKTAYYQLSLAQQNKLLNRQQKEYYERILAIAKRRYESGAITQVDLLNAQVSLYSTDNDLSDLQAAEKSAEAQLNVLLKAPTDSPLAVEPITMHAHPHIEREEAEKRMVENRFEIKAARLQSAAADNLHSLAWMGLLPDFQLTAGTTYYNIPTASPLTGTTNNTHTYYVGVQITLPIWFLFNERESIESTSKDRAVAEANVYSILNQSRASLVSTLESINSNEKKIHNYEQHLIPLAEQALNLALINYSAGKIDFQALSDAATTRRNTKRDYLVAVTNYLVGYAQLSQLLGEEV